MLEAMPASLFQEWQAYAQLEPFGPGPEDIRQAQTNFLLANQNRKKGKSPIPLEKFRTWPNIKATNLYEKFKSWALMTRAQAEAAKQGATSQRDHEPDQPAGQAGA